MLSNHFKAFVQGKPHHPFKIMTCFQYIIPKVNQEVQEGQGGSSKSPENKMSEKVIYSLVDKNHKSCVESGPLHNLFCDPPMGFVGKL